MVNKNKIIRGIKFIDVTRLNKGTNTYYQFIKKKPTKEVLCNYYRIPIRSIQQFKRIIVTDGHTKAKSRQRL